MFIWSSSQNNNNVGSKRFVTDPDPDKKDVDSDPGKKGFSTKSIFLLDPDPYNLIRIRFQGNNTDRADPDSDPQHWLPLQELQNEYSS